MSSLAPVFSPELLGVRDRINPKLLPPLLLIAHGVEGTVVGRAERHGPLVAHPAAHGPGLGKAYVMGLGWRTPADEAVLGGHVAEMLPVPNPPRRADGKGGFVDLTRGTGPVLSIAVAVSTGL